MKISALRLFNVKRFAGRGVAIEGIGDGVNVLSAANEFGKSTSFEAIHALFFQPHSSTAGDIRNLRPYSGGNPLIEADISSGDSRFRITKQYYGGRSAQVVDLVTARLVAQADEAENFIANLIKGGAAGPAGLLWVRQGVTGIEKRSRTEEDNEKQVRAGLLESVQGEVEAVTGGRRMAEIMAYTDGERLAFVTATGRPKAGGRYAIAIEERDRLFQEEQRLSGEVRAHRDALDGRTSAMKRLAELEDVEARQARRQAVETAQVAFDAARSLGEKLRTAEAERNLARERQGVADGNLTSFRDALGKARELGEKSLEANRRRGEAVDRRRQVGEAIENARAVAEAVEAEEQEARDLLAGLDAALKAREASDHLVGLAERLRQAEAARQAQEEKEAQLALANLPQGAIDELEALDVEIAKICAVAEAGRPSVAITYENITASRVMMGGAPLNDGQERTFERMAQLLVPGIGTIMLRSNLPIQSDGHLELAEAKRTTLLRSMGVDDLAGARKQQVHAQQLDAELRELRAQLALLAPEGLPKLREEVAALASTGAEIMELKGDPVQARSALDKVEERRKQARLALREKELMPESADAAFVEAETGLAALKVQEEQILAILGAEDGRGDRERAMSIALDGLNRALAEAEADVERLLAAAVDLASVEGALRRARTVEEAAETEANKLREGIAGLNAGIRARSDEAVEEKWRETVETLAAATVRVAVFERELAVLQRLSSALETARSEARELYLKPVMGELKPLLGLLFDDVSITFDDKTLLPQTILRNGQEEDIDRLSGGMREQLSVLTRLAFARLLARDGRPTPVILDDALVYSDDDRIERMFDALHRQSRDQQIIVFSCRQRAFQRLGGNVLEMTDWQP